MKPKYNSDEEQLITELREREKVQQKLALLRSTTAILLSQIFSVSLKTPNKLIDNTQSKRLTRTGFFKDDRTQRQKEKLDRALNDMESLRKKQSVSPIPATQRSALSILSYNFITKANEVHAGQSALQDVHDINLLALKNKESLKRIKLNAFYDYKNMITISDFKKMVGDVQEESISSAKSFKQKLSDVIRLIKDNPELDGKELLEDIFHSPRDRQAPHPIPMDVNFLDENGKVQKLKYNLHPSHLQNRLIRKYSSHLMDSLEAPNIIVDKITEEYNDIVNKFTTSGIVVKIPKNFKIQLSDFNDYYTLKEPEEMIFEEAIQQAGNSLINDLIKQEIDLVTKQIGEDISQSEKKEETIEILNEAEPTHGENEPNIHQETKQILENTEEQQQNFVPTDNQDSDQYRICSTKFPFGVPRPFQDFEENIKSHSPPNAEDQRPNPGTQTKDQKSSRKSPASHFAHVEVYSNDAYPEREERVFPQPYYFPPKSRQSESQNVEKRNSPKPKSRENHPPHAEKGDHKTAHHKNESKVIEGVQVTHDPDKYEEHIDHAHVQSLLKRFEATKYQVPSIIDRLLAAPSVLDNDIQIKDRSDPPKIPSDLVFENEEYKRLFSKIYVWHHFLNRELQQEGLELNPEESEESEAPSDDDA